MNFLTAILCLNIAAHIWFLIFEMFFWKKPIALKTFKMSQELANSSAPLAANQGLYNGFLAAGLIWGLMISDPEQAFSTRLFFLSCMAVAGIYGAISANVKILFIQALPAILGLAVLVMTR